MVTRVLDCTLRDGGYYNGWNFELETIERTIAGLNRAGVDIVEVGYKSLPDDTFYGLCKYCNDDYLEFLHDYPGTEYAFMIDVKQFVTDGAVDRAALERIVRPAGQSVFNWCRLATTNKHMPAVVEMCACFRDLGYRVAINLMGISLLDDEQLITALSLAARAEPDVFYFADSYGSMYPEDITRLIRLIREHYQGDIGLHTHDNQGLAFINSMSGLNEGVNYVDATLTGMGRGAGNLQLEQWLLWYSEKAEVGRYRPNEVLDIVNEYYLALKDQYRWGFSYLYMLSGLKNIHPSYCMAISNGTKFTLSTGQITEVLESIDKDARAAFNQKVLNERINRFIAGSEEDATESIPHFDMQTHCVDNGNCLIVAPGPDLEKYQFAFERFLRSTQMQLIECNHTGLLDEYLDRYVIVLNEERLHELRQQLWFDEVAVVTGQRRRGENGGVRKLYHFDYQIGPLDIQADRVSIPSFEAGQYAIALALRLGYRHIYLAGFVGYDDAERDAPMNDFFTSVRDQVEGARLTAVTPTGYQVLERRSIFTF